MFTQIITHLLLLAVATEAVKIPFIRDMIFVPISNSTGTIIIDRTCDECLCDAYSSARLLNCFPNDTCQVFIDVARTYRMQSTANARMYFHQQVLPDASECCMSDVSVLLSRVSASVPTYADVIDPGRLVLDNHGYLVTVSYTDQSLVRFHSNTMTRIDQPASPVFLQSPRSLAHRNGVYYVGFNSYILLVLASDMTIIHNVSSPALYDVGDMIFVNDGQQMIVTSMGNNRLVFFDRSSLMPYNYQFIGYRTVSGRYPRGLVFIHDALFYLSSWGDNTVYAFARSANATEWNETMVFNASSSSSSLGTSITSEYVTIDDCGRFWLSLGSIGVKIFDSQGSLRGSLHPPGSTIVDILVLDNYVMYLSDTASNRISRIDPILQC